MSSQKIYDAVATVGTYQKDGKEKKRYLTVGAVFKHDDGGMSMKLEALPVSKDWSGWLSFYEPKAFGDSGNASTPRARESAPAASESQDDSDIPF